MRIIQYLEPLSPDYFPDAVEAWAAMDGVLMARRISGDTLQVLMECPADATAEVLWAGCTIRSLPDAYVFPRKNFVV